MKMKMKMDNTAASDIESSSVTLKPGEKKSEKNTVNLKTFTRKSMQRLENSILKLFRE